LEVEEFVHGLVVGLFSNFFLVDVMLLSPELFVHDFSFTIPLSVCYMLLALRMTGTRLAKI